MKNTRTKRALAFFMSVILTFATFASDASLITTYAAGASESKLTASAKTDEGIEITKTAAISGDDVTLTFKVNGADGTKITQTTSETAVVFVMDVSKSMNQKQTTSWGGSGNTKTRLEAAKEAAINFATGLLANSKISVGVVTFAGTAKEVQALSKVKDDVLNSISNIDSQRGTNLQAGIYCAENMLKASSAAQKIIVVLSDGEPNYNYKVTGISEESVSANDGTVYNPYTFDYKETYGDGKKQKVDVTYNYVVTKVEKNSYGWNNSNSYYYYYEDQFGNGNWGYSDSEIKVGYTWSDTKQVWQSFDSGIAAMSEAKLAKDAGIDIYSIAYDVEDGSSAKTVMYNVANAKDSSSEYYYEATSDTSTDVTSAIDNVLKSIQKSIEEKVDGALGTKLVDTLPSYMTFNTEDSANSALITEKSISMNDESFTWDLGDLGSTDTKTVTVNAKLDINKMIEAYAKENNMTAAEVREKMANGSIEFNLNNLVTLSYKDKDGKDKENTDINAAGKAGVPKTAILTYPYTIKYTLDGESSTAYPDVTGYGYAGEEISVELYSTNESISSTKEIKRGETDLTPENGALTFDVEKDSTGAENVITVALHSATHKVTFMVDEVVYDKQDVAYGKDAAEPKKPEKTGYSFIEWDKPLTNITEDTVINAKFSINSYTVTFNVYDADGKLDEEQSVSSNNTYNTKVSVPSVTLPETTAEATYTGSGWKTLEGKDISGNEITVTEDATYVYNISKEIRKYNVNYYFVDAGGNNKLVVSHKDQLYGTPLGAAPDYSTYKTPESVEYVYNYSDWYTLGQGDEKIKYDPKATVTGTTNVYVKEIASAHPYKITYNFVTNYDGVLTTVKTMTVDVKYGDAIPGYPTDLYTENQGNAQYTYTYTVDEITGNVTGDATYTVTETRTTNSYPVKLIVNDDGNETTIVDGTYPYGTKFTDIKNYTANGKEGYTAQEIKWAWPDTYTVTGAEILTTNIVYDINVYNVNFVYELFDADTNTVVSTNDLGTVSIEHGEHLDGQYPTVTKQVDDDQYSFRLGEWNVGASEIITGHTTVTIRETRETKSYDVTFVVNYVEADGKTTYANAETKSTQVKYGTSATEQITLPTADALKEAQDNKYEYSYTVSGWDKEFNNITGDTTVTATVTREKIKYNVTFKIQGQNDITFTKTYGEEITVPSIPKKAADKTFTYEITKTNWPEGSTCTVTGNATYEASYIANYINYTITFKATNNFDDTDKADKTVGTKTDVHYDENTVNTSDIVTDSAYKTWYKDDAKYTYNLADFAASYTVTDRNTVVLATWSRTPVDHTITYVIDDAQQTATFAYGTDVTVLAAPSKVGYEFTGWTWTKASDKSSVTAPTTMPEYDLVATANFGAKTYTVKVNYLEDGTEKVLADSKIVEVKFDSSFSITSPAVAHFTVKTDDAVKSGTFNEAALNQASNGVLTLNAYYTRDSYTVRFFDCSSSATPISEQIVLYEGDATAPTEVSVPTTDISGENATVWWFNGWDKTFTKISSDLDVTAKYASKIINIKPSVSDNNVSTIVGTDVSGNILDNDTDKVTIKPADYEYDFANIWISEDGNFEVEAKAAGNKIVTVDYEYSVDYKNDFGTWLLSYKGSESLNITVDDPLKLTLSDKTVKYDGTEQELDFNAERFKNVTYTYSEAASDADSETSATMPKFINAGDYTVTVNAEYEIDGNTYTADPVSAVLHIEKRNVVLTSAADKKIYDGTPLTNAEVIVSGDGFAEGEGVTFEVTGTATNVSDSKEGNNLFTYTLNDGTDEANYDITVVYGTLTILPKPETPEPETPEPETPEPETPVPVTPTPVTPVRVAPVIIPVEPTQVEPVAEEETAPAETVVVEEETPLADVPKETEIEEEPVPEAAPSHCIIHWIILLITLVYAAYAALRGIQNKRELDDINDTEETANN